MVCLLDTPSTSTDNPSTNQEDSGECSRGATAQGTKILG
ncbi:hypothetical protein A2U01_0066755, partial [Trifolium medium]|nr:hypothetical protein [Trifolium medium]